MSEPVEVYVVQGDGLVLDEIVWQRYRRQTPGLVERVLDLNQGLADLGSAIPHGTVIILPIDTSGEGTAPVVVSLWD